jgi:hypothetical protein
VAAPPGEGGGVGGKGSPRTEQEPPLQTFGGGASISFVLKLWLE